MEKESQKYEKGKRYLKKFVIIEHGLNSLRADSGWFEPRPRGVDQRENEPLAAHVPTWRCLLDKVRNYFEQNPND